MIVALRTMSARARLRPAATRSPARPGRAWRPFLVNRRGMPPSRSCRGPASGGRAEARYINNVLSSANGERCFTASTALRSSAMPPGTATPMGKAVATGAVVGTGGRCRGRARSGRCDRCGGGGSRRCHGRRGRRDRRRGRHDDARQRRRIRHLPRAEHGSAPARSPAWRARRSGCKQVVRIARQPVGDARGERILAPQHHAVTVRDDRASRSVRRSSGLRSDRHRAVHGRQGCHELADQAHRRKPTDTRRERQSCRDGHGLERRPPPRAASGARSAQRAARAASASSVDTSPSSSASMAPRSWKAGTRRSRARRRGAPCRA